jgi:hypothetical protein
LYVYAIGGNSESQTGIGNAVDFDIEACQNLLDDFLGQFLADEFCSFGKVQEYREIFYFFRIDVDPSDVISPPATLGSAKPRV